MPVVTTAEYVVMIPVYALSCRGFGRMRTCCTRALTKKIVSRSGQPRRPRVRMIFGVWIDRPRGESVLAKVFPIKLKPGTQAQVEAIVQEFAPLGPGSEDGTLSFRVYRDPANVDYLLFVEHFADQAAYDAHTNSPAYKELIAGRFADLI